VSANAPRQRRARRQTRMQATPDLAVASIRRASDYGKILISHAILCWCPISNMRQSVDEATVTRGGRFAIQASGRATDVGRQQPAQNRIMARQIALDCRRGWEGTRRPPWLHETVPAVESGSHGDSILRAAGQKSPAQLQPAARANQPLKSNYPYALELGGSA
jgi:hypothetical protein